MSAMKKKSKKCLDCNLDISELHFNRKRCQPCVEKFGLLNNRKYVKLWKQDNPERVAALNKSWAKRFPIKKRLSHARDIANSRKHECNLTDEQFINYWNSPCDYCGNSIAHQTGIGLDRLNNDLHYTTDNVVSCCGDCNYIRGDILTYEEMKAAMKAVVEYRHGKESHNT